MTQVVCWTMWFVSLSSWSSVQRLLLFIRDGIRQYNIGNALTSSDPSDTHKTGKTCFFWSSVVFMLVISLVLSDAERLESHCNG